MKTINPTRSRALNDPINRRIQGFSFFNFFQLPQLILDFKHSLDAEMSLKDEELKRL